MNNRKSSTLHFLLVCALTLAAIGFQPASHVHAATFLVTNSKRILDHGILTAFGLVQQSDAGQHDVCKGIDPRGVARPQGAGCDIGAYEVPLTGTTRFVKWNANGSNTGTSWANAYTDLQTALTAAMNGDTIWVAAGTYKPTTGTNRAASFVLKKGVAIYGGFAGTETLLSDRNYETNVTVLSGDIGVQGDNSDNSYHVVIGSNTDNSTVLDGFTITGGNADTTAPDSSRSLGGGMYTDPGSPTVSNVIFADNFALFLGGGMYHAGGLSEDEIVSSPTLTNVIFKNNAAMEGGGFLSENYVHATLTNVTFDGNIATRAGAGMEDRQGTILLTDVVFKNNVSNFAAGGIQIFSLNASLTNVSFSNNSAVWGGGVSTAYANTQMNHVTFSNNTAEVGGGMWNSTSSPTLTDVIFTANTATDFGGGMYNEEGSNPVLTNVAFSNNTAGSGSGMYNTGSNPTLLNVTFSKNTGLPGSRGGAMVNDLGSSPGLTNVTFVENSVDYTGGAILNSYNSNPSLTNATFVLNSASDKGGAIFNWQSSPTLKHVTWSGNSSGEGGAIYNDENSHPSIVSSILYGDTGAEIVNNMSTASITYSIVQGGYAGIGNLDADPSLGPLEDNGGFTQTMALPAGSPAINKAADANCPATDQRGVARPQGTHCDMGAYEFQKTQHGADTVGVFRPSNGVIFLKNSNTSGFAELALNYGLAGDSPVVGDWDGNGTVTIGVYRGGSFLLRNSNSKGFADLIFAFGQVGDQPIAGDWDGDGVDTIGVYRPSTGQFLLRNSNSSGAPDISFFLGVKDDIGIAGDWNHDGVDTVGVFRPSNGVIFLKNKNETGFADVALNYGLPGDKPVVGDWDNDGDTTIGVFRAGKFLLRNSNTKGFADLIFALGFSSDLPIAGNWDGIP